MTPFNFFILLLLFPFITLLSCSESDVVVKEYFESHEMTYPIDLSGVTLSNINYVNIDWDELVKPGSREFLEKGIISIKEYFQFGNIQNVVEGSKAIVVNNPVFYKDSMGQVGLMVKVTVYGTGNRDKKSKLVFEMITDSKNLWKTDNFAYFIRDGYYKWQHGGWVY